MSDVTEKKRKTLLSYEEQIEHLKSVGVKFEIMSEEEAIEYLKNNTYYFKITAFRKNFRVYHGGVKDSQYINLDFAYLKDLAIIDMKLRYCLLQMALDIEHHVKTELMRKIVERGGDGYSIVLEYMDHLALDQRSLLYAELNRNKNNVYCGDLIHKYKDKYPVWVFLEVIPFGRVVHFYGFCHRNIKIEK